MRQEKKMLLLVELTYDIGMMHEDDEDGNEWFRHDVLCNPNEDSGLILHSNEIGDEVGCIRVIDILED